MSQQQTCPKCGAPVKVEKEIDVEGNAFGVAVCMVCDWISS